MSSPISIEKTPTKERLITTGERLFGQHGFDGISLREIAEAAGQRNRSAVQYHFKTKHDFVSAILADRVSRLDILRRERFELLKRSKENGDYSPRDLLKLMWLPDISITGPDGSHVFCRFSLQYYLKPNAGTHPFYRRDPRTGESTTSPNGRQSTLFAVGDMLHDHFKSLTEKTYYARISTLSMMFLSSVVEHDNTRALANARKRPSYDIEPIVTMSIGALSAPE